jgi:hypothetical protein
MKLVSWRLVWYRDDLFALNSFCFCCHVFSNMEDHRLFNFFCNRNKENRTRSNTLQKLMPFPTPFLWNSTHRYSKILHYHLQKIHQLQPPPPPKHGSRLLIITPSWTLKCTSLFIYIFMYLKWYHRRYVVRHGVWCRNPKKRPSFEVSYLVKRQVSSNTFSDWLHVCWTNH